MANVTIFKLRDKLLAVITLLVVVLVGGVLFTLNARLGPVGIEALNADLDRTRTVFNSFIEERAANLKDKAVLIAGLPRLTAALDVKHPQFDTIAATVTELCLDLNDTVRVPLFIVTDKEGRALFNDFHIPEVNLALMEGREPDPARMKSSPPESFADRPAVKKALNGEASRGGFIYHLKPDDPKVPEADLAFQAVAVPIGSHGRILGVLLLGFALDDKLAIQMNKMTDSEIAFDLDGKIYGSTQNLSHMASLAQDLSPIQASASEWMKSNESPKSFSVVLGGKNYLSLFSPFQDMNQTKLGDYVLLRPQEKALAVQETIQASILSFGIVGVLLAFILSLVIAQRITAPLNTLLKGVQEVGKGNLGVRVDVKSRDELGVLARAFNEMIIGLSEKERVTKILGKYVAPQVAKKLLASDEQMTLKGERRECAIMFTDIRGFTALSENMAPEKLVTELNEYFTQMVDVVFKYEGTLDKFIGDAIMAVWGAPVPFEDKEFRSVKCALEMMAALNHLNMERLKKNQVPLTMGIGLNTGVVVSGNLGSDKHSDYTVIGEEVNLASRLCSKAAPGQILISESMYRKLKGLVEVKALEPILLKGFTDPAKVYEVTGLTSV